MHTIKDSDFMTRKMAAIMQGLEARLSLKQILRALKTYMEDF